MSTRKAVKGLLPKPLPAVRSVSVRIPKHKLGNFPLMQHTRSIIRDRNIDTVIDVGANRGQFGRFLRDDVGYCGPIISFEPLPHAFEVLQKEAQGDVNWKVFNVAIGRCRGTLPFNVMASDDFSSFKHPNRDNLFRGSNEVVAQLEVKVDRLDQLIPAERFSFHRAFLKMDTQGYDLDVLFGADGLLDQIQAVQTELSFLPIYDAMPSFEHVLRELAARGFAISGMYPITLTKLQAVECDCLLVREARATPGDYITYQDLLLSSM